MRTGGKGDTEGRRKRREETLAGWVAPQIFGDPTYLWRCLPDGDEPPALLSQVRRLPCLPSLLPTPLLPPRHGVDGVQLSL